MSSNKKLRLTTEDEDRICCLPDHILHQILCHLAPQVAVRTSVLSKRWRYVWTTLHSLCFMHQSYSVPGLNNPRAEKDSFEKFVLDFLSHRNAAMDLYALNLEPKYCLKPILVESILHYAIQHNVKSLSIGPSYGNKLVYLKTSEPMLPIHLDTILFGNQRLQLLKLHGFTGAIKLPKLFGLPALERMELRCFSFSSSNSDIFSSCPNLKTLILRSCSIDSGLRILNIHAPRLLWLVILRVYQKKSHISRECEIVVDAPDLESFMFSGLLTTLNFSMAKFPSLQNVFIHLAPQHTEMQNPKLVKMLSQLCNAKCATFWLATLQALIRDPKFLEGHGPKFCNLKRLHLVANEHCEDMMPAIDDVVKCLCKSSPKVAIKLLQLSAQSII